MSACHSLSWAPVTWYTASKNATHMEKLIKNSNSNQEISKSIVNNMDLKDATEESLSTPTELLKAVFIFDTTMSTEIEK